jgi:hypothetical protein
MSVRAAGAAFVRFADQWATISTECDRVAEKNAGPIASRKEDAEACQLDEFGECLRSVGVSIAANGRQAEQAAVVCSGARRPCADGQVDRL